MLILNICKDYAITATPYENLWYPVKMVPYMYQPIKMAKLISSIFHSCT